MNSLSLTGFPSGPSTLGLFARGEMEALLLRLGETANEFSFPLTTMSASFAGVKPSKSESTKVFDCGAVVVAVVAVAAVAVTGGSAVTGVITSGLGLAATAEIKGGTISPLSLTFAFKALNSKLTLFNLRNKKRAAPAQIAIAAKSAQKARPISAAVSKRAHPASSSSSSSLGRTSAVTDTAPSKILSAKAIHKNFPALTTRGPILRMPRVILMSSIIY
mmetsp:Transcript_25939/g.48915  ORF Transcript_25939/g.48915 Transcript_25939/m.48915 type:complete len:219 (+) Transcript_25939:137-793(+)